MTYLAIVAEQGGKIAKYAEFETQSEAEAHAAQYGGFVFNNANDTPTEYINVDWAAQTAVAMTPEEIRQSQEPEAWANLRSTRNAKLSETDWTQVADAPVDQAAWATYRQALRDLPANTVDPFNPVWPVEPA